MENSKRPGENYDEEYSSKRPRGAQSEESSAHAFRGRRDSTKMKYSFMLKQLIPHHVSGVIIGSAGATIIDLQKSTNTQIKLSRNNEFYPGTSDRVLVISGSAEEVMNAHKEIWLKIFQKSDLNSDLKINLVIPNQVVGLIIGKNGTKVKKIKEQTGASIQISPKSENPRLLERVVTIAGNNQNQSNLAFEVIYDILKDEPNSILYPNENYSDNSYYLNQNNLATSSYTNSYGGLKISNQNLTSNNILNSTSIFSNMGYNYSSQKAIDSVKCMLRGAGFNPVSIDEIVYALVILCNYGLLPSEKEHHGPLHFNALSALMKDVSLAGHNVVELCDLKMSSLTDLSSMNRSESNLNKQEFSEVMYVNESLVGAILGPAGRNLLDIQSTTKTYIIISKKGEFAPGTRDRIVTIAGPSKNAVSKAILYLENCIQKLDKKRKYK